MVWGQAQDAPSLAPCTGTSYPYVTLEQGSDIHIHMSLVEVAGAITRTLAVCILYNPNGSGREPP